MPPGAGVSSERLYSGNDWQPSAEHASPRVECNEMRTLAADRGDAGQRLDLMLRRHLAGVPGATRTRVQSWIEGGHVTVNGTPVRRVSTRTALGDVVAIEGMEISAASREPSFPEPGAGSLEPAQILYEDDALLAVAKPAGIVVHPTYKHLAGTLLDAVRAYGRAWPASQQPSIVGRLDKLTSGVVIVAKGPVVHAKLQRAMTVAEKDYLAVVHGRVNVARGRIDLKLGRDPGDRRRVVASATIGADSRTEFERLAKGREASLLRCRLVTGRMHQIRVHLLARGWPIVGDPKYAGRGRPVGDTFGFPRQALHAWRTAFAHPVSGERITVEAAVPDDLDGLLARILGPCWSDALPPCSSRSPS
jgi:23S rRNA pseudouridine1911/1915/1917 synthase